MSIDYDRLQKILKRTTPGPWTVEDDGYDIIVADDEGHRLGWGEQVRFKFEAGDQTHDPALVALAPDLAAEVIRLREGLVRLQRDMRHQPHQYLATEVANAIRIILQGEPNGTA